MDVAWCGVGNCRMSIRWPSVFALISIAACKTTPAPTEHTPPQASPTASAEPASKNRDYVERLVRGRVTDPTACTSDAECVVSNVNDAACGCCTCVPIYAISQRAAATVA